MDDWKERLKAEYAQTKELYERLHKRNVANTVLRMTNEALTRLDCENMQLAHMNCNRQKSDKLTPTREVSTGVELVSNRALLLTFDWKSV